MWNLRQYTLVILCLFIGPTVVWAGVSEDNFNDNILSPFTWTYAGDEEVYPMETNGHLEIRAIDMAGDSGGVIFKGIIPLTKNFRVQVDFNASECTNQSMMYLAIHNMSTNYPDRLRIHDAILIGNGNGPSSVGRSWIATKLVNDQWVETVNQSTSAPSGTLYIEHRGNVFYVSPTGYGPENAMATYTVDGWTNCSGVFITLLGFSNQLLSGQGSYFDNFRFQDYPCACDLNNDGRCNMRDWLIFGQDWGRIDCPIAIYH